MLLKGHGTEPAAASIHSTPAGPERSPAGAATTTPRLLWGTPVRNPGPYRWPAGLRYTSVTSFPAALWVTLVM